MLYTYISIIYLYTTFKTSTSKDVTVHPTYTVTTHPGNGVDCNHSTTYLTFTV